MATAAAAGMGTVPAAVVLVAVAPVGQGPVVPDPAAVVAMAAAIHRKLKFINFNNI